MSPKPAGPAEDGNRVIPASLGTFPGQLPAGHVKKKAASPSLPDANGPTGSIVGFVPSYALHGA